MTRDGDRTYGPQFHSEHRAGSRRSAEVVVPILMEMLHPKSVVDVGCGVGSWLAVFRVHGVSVILGVDGTHAKSVNLDIPPECFVSRDLENDLEVSGTFDLVLCLEVAEHLPDTAAEGLVRSLTRLGPVVLFSAAIPGQGGTGHRNEQWPSYWAHLFAGCGYEPMDVLRPLVWLRSDIEFWYAQNSVLYVRRDLRNQYSALSPLASWQATEPLPLVHPRLFRWVVGQRDAYVEHPTVARLVAALVVAIRRSLGRRLSRLVSA